MVASWRQDKRPISQALVGRVVFDRVNDPVGRVAKSGEYLSKYGKNTLLLICFNQ